MEIGMALKRSGGFVHIVYRKKEDNMSFLKSKVMLFLPRNTAWKRFIAPHSYLAGESKINHVPSVVLGAAIWPGDWLVSHEGCGPQKRTFATAKQTENHRRDVWGDCIIESHWFHITFGEHFCPIMILGDKAWPGQLWSRPRKFIGLDRDTVSLIYYKQHIYENVFINCRHIYHFLFPYFVIRVK